MIERIKHRKRYFVGTEFANNGMLPHFFTDSMFPVHSGMILTILSVICEIQTVPRISGDGRKLRFYESGFRHFYLVLDNHIKIFLHWALRIGRSTTLCLSCVSANAILMILIPSLKKNRHWRRLPILDSAGYSINPFTKNGRSFMYIKILIIAVHINFASSRSLPIKRRKRQRPRRIHSSFLQRSKAILSANSQESTESHLRLCTLCRRPGEIRYDYGFPVCRRCIDYYGPSHY